MLVEQGVVDINERDERGATLAHKAAGQGHLEILRWLIEMGASMDLTTQSGETPKDVARRFGQLACLKVLSGGIENIDISVSHQKTEFHRRKLAPKEEALARAKQKYEELQKQFEIAKKNFRQLGGQFEEDNKRETIEYESQKYLFDKLCFLARVGSFLFFFFRKIEELDIQLESERLKREKLESELDECRHEIARLVNTLRSLQEKNLATSVRFYKKVQLFVVLELFFFSSNDHQVILVNISIKNHRQLQTNHHDD